MNFRNNLLSQGMEKETEIFLNSQVSNAEKIIFDKCYNIFSRGNITERPFSNAISGTNAFLATAVALPIELASESLIDNISSVPCNLLLKVYNIFSGKVNDTVLENICSGIFNQNSILRDPSTCISIIE